MQSKENSVSKYLAIIIKVLAFVGILTSLFDLFSHHSGSIPGDSYTYVSFARLLARYKFNIDGPIARLIDSNHCGNLILYGPVWNTSIHPSGSWIYSVALGYPLVLALFLKTGGTWLMLHTNFFILLGILLFGALCLQKSGKRSEDNICIAAICLLIFLKLDIATIASLLYPWRDPLILLLFLISLYGYLQFISTKWNFCIAISALASGFAYSVKESCIITALLFIYLFTTIPKTTIKRRILIFLIYLVFGLIGLLPLLIQNTFSTGTPLLSLQAMRALSNYSMFTPGTGLALANTHVTFARYLHLLNSIFLFKPIFVVFAICGMILSAKETVIGRVFVLLCVLHLILIFQWGNADMRHVFLLFFPYSYFLSYFIITLLQEIPLHHSIKSVVATIVISAFIVFPFNRSSLGKQKPIFKYRNANKLSTELSKIVGSNSVVLANRCVRDIVGAYSDINVIRLHDLNRINCVDPIQSLIESDISVFFIDNTDLDPKHIGNVNWTMADLRQLLAKFDLSTEHAWSSSQNNLQTITQKNMMYLYSVGKWTNKYYSTRLQPTKDGSAFLFVNQRTADLSFHLEINGEHHYRLPKTPYLPLERPQEALTSTEWELLIYPSANSIMPTLKDTKLISWNETIHIPLGIDSFPDDAAYFPQKKPISDNDTFRNFQDRVKICLPARFSSTFFTTYRFIINPSCTTRAMYVDKAGLIPIRKNRTAFFSVSKETKETSCATNLNYEIQLPPNKRLEVDSLSIYTAYRKLYFKTAEKTKRLHFSGVLVPDTNSSPPPFGQVRINGVTVFKTSFDADPFKHEVSITVNIAPNNDSFIFDFINAGIIEPCFIESNTPTAIPNTASTVAVPCPP